MLELASWERGANLSPLQGTDVKRIWLMYDVQSRIVVLALKKQFFKHVVPSSLGTGRDTRGSHWSYGTASNQ